jgi:gamma-soluble NSF attachment protein
MDVEYARLARELQLPKGSTAPKANVIENAAASYISPNAPGGSKKAPAADDEDEGGLC